MRISNVMTGYADTALQGKRSDPLGALASRTAVRETSAADTSANSHALERIVAAYDVGRISPTEFSEMLNQLRKAGVLNDGDLNELASIRVDLEAAGIDANEKIDLREFYAERLAALQQSGASGQRGHKEMVEATARKLDWLEKLALLHEQPDAAGLSAIA
jgi:hypothetical protein